MINKYIALSALACAAILPLSAQAQSNSADADVNITLVQPIAVEYVAGSGSMGSLLIPEIEGSSFSFSYGAAFSSNDDTATHTSSQTLTVLEKPTTFDFTVTGGSDLIYKLKTSITDSNSDDGILMTNIESSCQRTSGQFDKSSSNGTSFKTGICAIQSGTTKVRVAPEFDFDLFTIEAVNNAKIATLTVEVAYD